MSSRNRSGWVRFVIVSIVHDSCVNKNAVKIRGFCRILLDSPYFFKHLIIHHNIHSNIIPNLQS